jgi:hypothetical protein
MKTRQLSLCAAFAALITATASPSSGQQSTASPDEAATESQTERLAKETQNPVANLISVPFQNNFNFGIGPNDATQWVLNVQPVIPITLNKDWNLITRTIMPIINQPSPAAGIPSAFGLGDINPSVLLSPANSGKLIWGVGPTMTFPTASDSLLWCRLATTLPGAVSFPEMKNTALTRFEPMLALPSFNLEAVRGWPMRGNRVGRQPRLVNVIDATPPTAQK